MTLRTHLATGATTIARCWAIARMDGLALGFTDHDLPLTFDGLTFRPDTGLTARAVVQGTGLAVDNSEALGVLSSDAITEADIDAGRWDSAEVRLWHVNWANPEERDLRFRGTLGEIRRGNGAFQAELRGLTEALNRPTGRLYQTTCSATLGDAACGIGTTSRSAEVEAGDTDGRTFRPEGLGAFDPRWFERGRLTVLTGEGRGLSGVIKADGKEGGDRLLELWSPIRATIRPTDRVRLEPGCDKRAATCRVKFDNLVNFRGFPFVPGEDWLLAVPSRGAIR
ncbi:GTA FAD/FMN-containing dehydrogenase [Rubellimicrobium mesophilum DSM 19309]|uniref:GTA FAD/FMN-containing dehydrogenase n=1 Tax=Rubellimicrobium mesophilum DSM 19309 TaxID=442562 RepID=A0A017HJ95_9RHOB|nr:DUF2163 domain-containing protein [Rubellimicrobium mesophilum]EYD74426.1 GTA FAD/FMN-containing dehydrogenase [Rubellimicrobium mesophilum DSM 19309]